MPTPVGLSGVIATDSWQGFVLSVVCAIIGFVVWLPFIKKEKSDAVKDEV